MRPEDQVSKVDTTVSGSLYTIIPKTADWLHTYPVTRSRQLSFVTVSNPVCLKFDLCVWVSLPTSVIQVLMWFACVAKLCPLMSILLGH